jgi:hypothetical protein
MRRRVYTESAETWQQEVETCDQNLGEKASHFHAAAHSIGDKLWAEFATESCVQDNLLIQNGFGSIRSA